MGREPELHKYLTTAGFTDLKYLAGGKYVFHVYSPVFLFFVGPFGLPPCSGRA